MTKPTGRPVGRPSKYSEALADRIVEAMIHGSDLVAICQQPGFPDRALYCTRISGHKVGVKRPA